MTFVLRQLLKSAIRIEKKLDEILRQVRHLAERNPGSAVIPHIEPLNQPGQSPCPLCRLPVKYMPVTLGGLIDGTVTVRVCGCEPQTMELPMSEGELR